jgi:hypothetical protein
MLLLNEKPVLVKSSAMLSGHTVDQVGTANGRSPLPATTPTTSLI